MDKTKIRQREWREFLTRSTDKAWALFKFLSGYPLRFDLSYCPECGVYTTTFLTNPEERRAVNAKLIELSQSDTVESMDETCRRNRTFEPQAAYEGEKE
jgi:hypothetical protein